MKEKFLKLYNNTHVFGTAVVTTGLFASAVINYLVQLALGRYLTIEDYGVFNAVLALSYIFVVPNTAFSIAVIKFTSEFKSLDDFGSLTYFFWRLSFFAVGAGLFVFFLVVGLRQFVSDYLNLGDPYLVLIFGIFMGVSLLSTVPSAYLQGLLRFKGFAFFSVISSLIKFFVVIIFLVVWDSVRGVYLGMSISVLLSFFIALSVLKKNFTKQRARPFSQSAKKLANFGAAALLVNLGLVMANNIDVVLVKHFFNLRDAGIYSTVVTVGKILLFGTGMVATVMFPQVSVLFSSGGDYLKRFRYFLYFQVLALAVGSIPFVFLPKLLTRIVFPNFVYAYTFLPKFTIFVSLYVLISFMTAFFLAINKTKVYIFIFFSLVIQFIAIYMFHDTINHIITVNILSSLLLLVMLLLYYLSHVRFYYSAGIQSGKNNQERYR